MKTFFDKKQLSFTSGRVEMKNMERGDEMGADSEVDGGHHCGLGSLQDLELGRIYQNCSSEYVFLVLDAEADPTINFDYVNLHVECCGNNKLFWDHLGVLMLGGFRWSTKGRAWIGIPREVSFRVTSVGQRGIRGIWWTLWKNGDPVP